MWGIQMLSLTGITVTAVLFDLCEGRIPNMLIAAGLAMGFIWRMFAGGIPGILVFFMGASVPVLVLGILYYFRMIGAGDIKLLCVAGGFFGPGRALRCVLCSLLAAAVISVIRILQNRSFRERFSCFWRYVRDCLENRKWSPYMERVDADAKFRFSVPVLIGVLLNL